MARIRLLRVIVSLVGHGSIGGYAARSFPTVNIGNLHATLAMQAILPSGGQNLRQFIKSLLFRSEEGAGILLESISRNPAVARPSRLRSAILEMASCLFPLVECCPGPGGFEKKTCPQSTVAE